MNTKICTDDMLTVTVYADTVTDYTAEQRNALFSDDNMVDVNFPREIVEKWFAEYMVSEDGWTADSFDVWYNLHSTCDEVDGLFQFSIDNGYHPVLPKPRKYTVQLSATYEVWAFNEDEAVESAENQHSIGDYWIYVDGKAYN